MLKALRIILVASLLCGCTMASSANVISQSNTPAEYHYNAEGRIPEIDLTDVDLSHTDTLFGVIYTEYPEFRIISYNEEDVPIVFEQDGKHGYKDKSGNVIVAPIYDSVFPYQNGFGESWNSSGENLTRYYFNIDGDPLDFDELQPIKEGIAVVKKGNKYGFVNAEGEIIIPIIYDDVYLYDSELYVYAVKDGVGICLDLKYGYEKVYEKFDINRKDLYDKVIDVKDYEIAIVDCFVVINGEEFEPSSPLPLCIFSSLEFDTYVDGEGIVKQKGSLKHDGAHEPQLAVRFEKSCTVAVPSYQKMNLKDIAKITNTEKYQVIVNQYLLDSGIGKEGIIEQCFEGDIYGDGKKGAIIKVRDAYGERWEKYAQSQEGEKLQFFDCILAIDDVNRPAEYEVLSEEKGIYYDDGEFFAITTRDILCVADINHDNKAEVITLDGGYEWYTASVLSIAPSAWAVEEVKKSESMGLVPMNMRGRYKMNITRAEFCKLAVTLLGKRNVISKVQSASDNPYTDTDDSDVLLATQLGIVNGKGNSKFDPYGYITREEAATMLYRSAKVLKCEMPNENEMKIFADAHQISDWAKEAVGYVSAAKDTTNGKEIMGGVSKNLFSPDSYYTREQAFITIKRLHNAR